MLGWHWIAQASDCKPAVLGSASALTSVLLSLADKLDLHTIAMPLVHQGAQGLVGIVLLAESHAAIHTCAADNTAHIDIFSCKSFDTQRAQEVVCTHLGTHSLHVETVLRGQLHVPTP